MTDIIILTFAIIPHCSVLKPSIPKGDQFFVQSWQYLIARALLMVINFSYNLCAVNTSCPSLATCWRWLVKVSA